MPLRLGLHLEPPTGMVGNIHTQPADRKQRARQPFQSNCRLPFVRRRWQFRLLIESSKSNRGGHSSRDLRRLAGGPLGLDNEPPLAFAPNLTPYLDSLSVNYDGPRSPLRG